MFGNEHSEIDCPVSIEALAKLYRTDPGAIAEKVRLMSPTDKAKLALFCYGRAHLREIGLTIAGLCDAQALVLVAGTVGQVLASQSRGRIQEFGLAGVRTTPKAKVTLAKFAA